MFIRQLNYLVTLSRTRHFARAAEECHVSQPALSTAIQHLEEELGVTIVQRGKRYHGLTPEGEKLLVWARRVLADWEGMKQEASKAQEQLSGHLRIGAVPTAMPFTPRLCSPIRKEHPLLRQTIQSLNSETILRDLENFEIDLGVTYIEDWEPDQYQTLSLYRERYLLIAGPEQPLPAMSAVTWKDAAELPLCLLTPDMQNRRIIDAAFARFDVKPNVVMETDSVFALFSLVSRGSLYSVVPHSLLYLSDLQARLRAMRLDPPETRAIGLVVVARDPVPPVISAVWEISGRVNPGGDLDELITEDYPPINAN